MTRFGSNDLIGFLHRCRDEIHELKSMISLPPCRTPFNESGQWSAWEEAKIFLKNYDGVNVEVAREHYLFLRNWADARYQTLRRLLENEDEPVSVEDAGVMMDEIAEFLQIAESIGYRFQAHHSKRIDERAFLFGDHTRPKYDHTPPSAVSSNDISENDELATVRRHALISFPLLDGHFPFAEY